MKYVSTFLSRGMRQSFTHEVYGQLQGGDSYASHHYWICGWGKIENGAMLFGGYRVSRSRYRFLTNYVRNDEGCVISNAAK